METIKNKLLIGILTIAVIAAGFIFQSDIFKAALTDSGANNSTGKDLYISDNYSALSEDTGNIIIRSEQGLTNIAALTFTLKYNQNFIHFSDQVVLGNFTDNSAQSFKPEMIVITPDNTKGVLSVDIASSQAFNLTAGEIAMEIPMTIQNTVKDGDVININFAETQIIDSLFNMRSAQTGNGKITIQANINNQLKVLNSVAISATQIDVYFDDFLTGASAVTAKLTSNITSTVQFSSVVSEVNFTGIQIDTTNGKKITLTTDAPMSDNTTYKLIFGTGPIGNIKTALDINHSTTYFSTGGVGAGSLSLINASNSDQNTISLNFSSTLEATTSENPTRYKVFNAQGIEQVISSISISGTTASLVMQSSLINGEKYYVIAEDVSSISKQKVQLLFANIAGETQILTLSPESLTASEGNQTITITGQNINQISSVTMNGNTLGTSSKTVNSMKITIPGGQASGLYDLQFAINNGNIVVKEDFLLIEDDSPQIKVISTESYASPRRVPNDGITTTTLWVLIEDPRGVGDINKVTLDLRSIGGKAITPMVGVDENGQLMIVDNKRWFKLETAIPTTVKTSETERTIAVTAEDPHGNKAYGTISLIVTNNIKSSEAPEVLDAYGVPTQLRPGEKIGFYARIKDLDGIGDIDKVVADLGPIGLGPVTLISANEALKTTQTNNSTTVAGTTNDGTAIGGNTETTTGTTSQTQTVVNNENIPQERITMWYGVEDIVLPKSTAAGTFTVNVIASDVSGEEAVSPITIHVILGNAPMIDGERTEITPREKVVNDGADTFNITTYVSDADGMDDITSVTVDLKEIGGTMVELDLQGDIKEGQRGGWFIAKNLTVAKGTIAGISALPIYASDKQGNESVYDELEIDVTHENEVGRAPIINSQRSYTIPASIPSDGESEATFNVFIEKHEFEITQVIADLSNIAEYTGEAVSTTADSANSCLGASARIVCLVPGIQEGTKGQWYSLPNIRALPTTQSSMEPYRIRITAIDEKGKTGDGFIALNIGDGTLPTPQTGFPKVRMAISTSPTSLEVLFSNPIDPKKVKLGAFKITDTIDTRETLAVKGTTINADATVVTITTSEQEPERFYTLFADADQLELKEAQYTDNHAEFVGFDKQDIPPQIIKITAVSPTMIEVIFSEGLRPSSVSQNARDITIFTHEAQPVRLDVTHVEFRDDNQTIRISTKPQKSGGKYMLRVNNILSAAGVRVGGDDRPRQTAKKEYFGIHKYFTGFKAKPQETQTIIEAVDFDKNGKVDFTDFTIFSSVYGQTLVNPTVDVKLPEEGNEVIIPENEARAAELSESASEQIPTNSPVTEEVNTQTSQTTENDNSESTPPKTTPLVN